MSPAIPVPPENAHRMKYRVSYADTDRMDRVYYGNYLAWFERARTELLRDAGVPYKQMEEREMLLPVRHCDIRYYGFTEYDDMLTFVTWVTKIRRASATFVTAVFRQGEESPATVGTVELACVNKSGKPVPIADDIVTLLNNYLA